MNKKIKDKLANLPKEPGVYFHKNAQAQIIYVGKAAVLKNRVSQYFHKSRVNDPKTDALVKEIADVDWIVTADEIEALFLEAEMIRRYQPHYNVLLRDDKSVAYVRINSKDQYPAVTITRSPLDDGADYYGPFLQAQPLRRSLRYLRKIFPYSTHNTLPPRACLHYHLGLCPGPETPDYNEAEHKEILRKLALYIKGSRVQLLQELESEMSKASDRQDFRLAAKKRDSLHALKSLRARIIFSDKENLDLSKDHALSDMAKLFGLAKPPRRIEGYDISHMSGTDNVASMVVFTNGIADKRAYRKFKMKISGNDDFAHINEVLTRRLRKASPKTWPLPNMFLIDGGKGQLASALRAREMAGVNIPMIGLAKKNEEIIIHHPSSRIVINIDFLKSLNGYISSNTDEYISILLPKSAHLLKLLQRIRDESHRFAVNYHSYIKVKRQRDSLLDNINGVGPVTKRKLLKKFGSLSALELAKENEIASVVGTKKAKHIFACINKGAL